MARIKRWRFIDDGEHNGSWNMAMDEALGESVSSGGPPTLRVYRFDPPVVTVGRFQSFTGWIDLDSCRRENIQVVRRPTGGLAILHLNDFTYSVTMPRYKTQTNGDYYYTLVASGIVESLGLIGISAKIASHKGRSTGDSCWCFGGEFGVDIEWGERKICGSARRMFARSVLQHGSLFLRSTHDTLHRITTGPEAARDRLPVTVGEAAGRDISWEELRDAFVHGFSRALGVLIESGRPTSDEEERTRDLIKEKYGKEDWLSPKCDNI